MPFLVESIVIRSRACVFLYFDIWRVGPIMRLIAHFVDRGSSIFLSWCQAIYSVFQLFLDCL